MPTEILDLRRKRLAFEKRRPFPFTVAAATDHTNEFLAMAAKRRRDRIAEDQARPVEPMQFRDRLRFTVTPAISPVPSTVKFPKLVPFDEHIENRRSRAHEQIVARILNSLILSGELVQKTDGSWQLGYRPTDQQSFGPGPPVTLQDALDRIAVLEKALNGGLGP